MGSEEYKEVDMAMNRGRWREKDSRGLCDFGRSKLICDFSHGGHMGFLHILLNTLLLIFYV